MVSIPGEQPSIDKEQGEQSQVPKTTENAPTDPWLPPRETVSPAEPTAEQQSPGQVMPPPYNPSSYGAPPHPSPYPYGIPAYPITGGSQPVGWHPVQPVLPTEQPLPAYREPDPKEDTTTPLMITAVSPLSRERLQKIEKQTRMPFWPVTICTGILLAGFSLSAISVAAEQSIPGGIGTAAFCIALCVIFLVMMMVAFSRRQRELRQLVNFAAEGQETAGVIEIYADRAVKITPRTRTVVHLRQRGTTLWESPHTLTISDGYAAIVWQAEDLTVPALERLRGLLYPAVKPENRKSSGRMIVTAASLLPLPDIAFPEDTLCTFRYQPDRKRETDRKIGILTARSLPFNAVGAAMGGVLLAGLYPLSVPLPMAMALFAIPLLLLMQGLTTAVIWHRLRRTSQQSDTLIGVAFTENGIAVEENGCLRFLSHGCFKSLMKKNIVVLQTPVGQLCIPWDAVPDPDLVRRLLMLGE